jgi:hypothetical protein
MQLRPFCLALALVGVCSQNVSSQRPASRWAFTIEQRYGNRPGTELVSAQTIAVDGMGRLYVADSRPAVVKVFTPDGTLLRVIGRQGGGPGEYRNPWIAARGASVVVHDPAQSRTSVFDTSGKYLRSWSSFCCHQNEIAIDQAFRVVIPALAPSPGETQGGPVRRIPYVRYDLEGRVLDTIAIRAAGEERLWTVPRRGSDGKPGAGTTSVVVPFTPRQQFAWAPTGGYVSGWSGALQLYRSVDGKDSIPILSRRGSPDRIPEALRKERTDSAVAELARMVGAETARGAVRLSDVPSDAPAFTRLLIDEDGNIWARQLVGTDRTKTMFLIFGPNGADLGRAVLPAFVPDWGGIAFGRGTIFVRTEDDDGQPIVLRIGIARSHNR